jgi:hypothetical protein
MQSERCGPNGKEMPSERCIMKIAHGQNESKELKKA